VGEEVLDMLIDFAQGALMAVAQELMTDNLTVVGGEQRLNHGRRYCIIVGLAGQYRGRVIIEVDATTAEQLTQSMNFGEPLASLLDQCLYLAEFTNMVAGKIVTLLNNSFRGIELRLSPPAIFSGHRMDVSTPNIRSKTLFFKGVHGEVKLDVGLEGV